MSEPAGVDLSDRVVIVTGGTRGIGAAIAGEFLAAGADVVVGARREPDSPVEAHGRTALFVRADVRDPESCAALVATTTERFGRLDIVINNAGGSPSADSATVSPRFITKIVELNLLAPFFVAQAAFAALKESEGLIINIGSVAGAHPAPNTAAYSASKAGLTMLTQCLGMDFAPRVRVNQVTVGLVRTELSHLHYGDEAGQSRVAATVPIGRMATPSDIAHACLLLASPLADYVTGAELAVHGGGEIPARHLAALEQS